MSLLFDGAEVIYFYDFFADELSFFLAHVEHG
jgi:hypothetical protein